MNKDAVKKAYLTAAVCAGAIMGSVMFYILVVELLRGLGHKPPLQAPAAYAAKYALFLLGVSPLLLLKLAGARLGGEKSTPEETVKALTVLAIARAALCELPAVSGLILFLLTGYRLDFYLLIVFSLALGMYNFPRLNQWEERLRGDFGQL